jgi:hypothetical protein
MSVVARLSRWTALSVFVLAPLPFGSVDAPWITTWIILLSLSLAFADVSKIQPVHVKLIAAIAAGFGAFAAIAIIQASGIEGIGRFDPIWHQAGALLGETLKGRIGVTAKSPVITLAPTMLFTLAMLRAIVLSTEANGGKAICKAIAWAAVIYAIYGAVSFISNPAMLLWREKEAYLSSLTGTFINRNTAATYFGSATIVWTLTLMSELRRRLSRSLSFRDSLWLMTRDLPRPIGIALVATLLCLGATAATGSRAGFVLTLVTLGLACALYADLRVVMRAIGYRRLIVVILLLLGLIELLGGTVGTRVDQRGLVDIARFEIYKTQFDIILNHAWFGIGLGGFESYFPSQRPVSIGSAGIIDRGHSTPLEIAVEMGLPVTALLGVLALIFLTLLAVAAVRTRRSDIIASLCVALLGLLHSCVDFSLQIPGYAVTYAALVATGLAHIGAARGRAQAPPAEATGKREAG